MSMAHPINFISDMLIPVLRTTHNHMGLDSQSDETLALYPSRGIKLKQKV